MAISFTSWLNFPLNFARRSIPRKLFPHSIVFRSIRSSPSFLRRFRKYFLQVLLFVPRVLCCGRFSASKWAEQLSGRGRPPTQLEMTPVHEAGLRYSVRSGATPLLASSRRKAFNRSAEATPNHASSSTSSSAHHAHHARHSYKRGVSTRSTVSEFELPASLSPVVSAVGTPKKKVRAYGEHI